MKNRVVVKMLAVKEEVSLCLELLRTQKIKVVVFDMDHTMSASHCGTGQPLSKLDEYVDNVSVDFVHLAKELASRFVHFHSK